MSFLRDLLEDTRDGEWGKGEAAPEREEMIVIRGTDFEDVRNGSLASAPRRFLEQRHADRKALLPWDIIIETAGGSKDRPTGRTLLLKPGLFKAADRRITCASFARFLRVDPGKVDPKFLFWLLQHLYDTRRLLQFHTQHTGVARFQFTTFATTFDLTLPAPETQRRIASILSAYDDLIENNTRRIAILEEMARRLYDEWFVNFRYPGANGRMHDTSLGSVPEDWEAIALEQVCSRITDGSHSSPPSVTEGVPMASVKDMTDWDFDLASCRKIARQDYEELARNDCRPLRNDVVIAKDGSYLKHCFAVSEERELVVLSSIAILRPNGRIHPDLLASQLRHPTVKQRMKGYVSGVAIPRIVLRDFRRFEILVPSASIQKRWGAFSEPLFECCRKLFEANIRLRAARDLLLPKLISGEIDVFAAPTPEVGARAEAA